jgi:hypothetical protein
MVGLIVSEGGVTGHQSLALLICLLGRASAHSLSVLCWSPKPGKRSSPSPRNALRLPATQRVKHVEVNALVRGCDIPGFATE